MPLNKLTAALEGQLKFMEQPRLMQTVHFVTKRRGIH